MGTEGDEAKHFYKYSATPNSNNIFESASKKLEDARKESQINAYKRRYISQYKVKIIN